MLFELCTPYHASSPPSLPPWEPKSHSACLSRLHRAESLVGWGRCYAFSAILSPHCVLTAFPPTLTPVQASSRAAVADGRTPHREQQWQADGRGAASAFSSCLKPLAAADNTWPHREQQWQTDGCGAASAFSSCLEPLAAADNTRPHREQQWQADGRGAASAFSSCLKPLAAADNTWPHREQQWQADGRGAASAFSSCLKPLAAADNTRSSRAALLVA
ncbi:unnamed protein product [Closterium sp. Naga37s-1]|nr:unnamed protein product [Closterium sp. Naga37s-1]